MWFAVKKSIETRKTLKTFLTNLMSIPENNLSSIDWNTNAVSISTI